MSNPTTSSSFVEVFRTINSLDASIFYEPAQFKAYVIDLYSGNRVVRNTFIRAIERMEARIASRHVDQALIDTLRIEPDPSAGVQPVIRNWLTAIYITHQFDAIRDYIETLTVAPTSSKRKRHRGAAEKIKMFRASAERVHYMDEVTFSWECEAEGSLILYANGGSQDVSDRTSQEMSVMGEIFSLVLYGVNRNPIHKRTIKLTVIDFCINCGEPMYGMGDVYCWKCGFKHIKSKSIGI